MGVGEGVLAKEDGTCAIQTDGYVAVFLRIFMPRLLATEPPKTEPMPQPPPVIESTNSYIPLAHRK